MKETKVIQGQLITRSAYSAVHYWLKYNYGIATKCEGENCTGISKNYEWAKKRGELYDFKRENFFQLCRSCHSKYDFTEESIRKMREYNSNTHKKICKAGHPLTEDNVYRYGRWRYCRKCQNRRRHTKEAMRKKKEWMKKYGHKKSLLSEKVNH